MRLVIAAPLAACVMHLAQPVVLWSAWCGICGTSLVTMWSFDAAVSALRRRLR